MRFCIHHRTHYRYTGSASESFMETRLRPADTPWQRLIDHRIEIRPDCNVHDYIDYFGNHVQTFSIVRRHESLTVDSHAQIETTARMPPPAAWDVTMAEARQIYHSEKLRHYEFQHPSPAVQLDAVTSQLAHRFFPPRHEIGPALTALTEWIHANFRYRGGSTNLATSVADVLRRRQGVCQDFAQVMIAILRSAEIPARYVVGYIETESQRQSAQRALGQTRLVGTAESHAWVEVGLPGGVWWPLDPTNNCAAGERHVRVATGRDFHDCTPTRGVFKETQTEKLTVMVKMKRTRKPRASRLVSS